MEGDKSHVPEFQLDISVKELIALDAMFQSDGYRVYRRVLESVNADILDGLKMAMGEQRVGASQGQAILIDEIIAYPAKFKQELDDRKAQDDVV